MSCYGFTYLVVMDFMDGYKTTKLDTPYTMLSKFAVKLFTIYA